MIQAGDECERLEARLEGAPDDFSGWLELSRLRNSARRAGEALLAANNALTLRPSSLEALYERGVAHLELGRPSEAAGAFTSILAIQPLHPNALISLGWAYYHFRKFDQAGLIWEQAIRVASNPVGILQDLAVCYQRLGDFEKVAETWERVLVHDAAHPQALHHLAALGKRPPLERASEEYIVQLFDGFAGDFDATLASVGYEGPRLLAEIVAQNASAAPRGWRILDLGCGTGLCGVYLRPWAEWLEGVDLSTGMLDKAKARKVYDKLHCEELLRFLDGNHESFDLIVASDTFIYFGDLELVMKKMATRLRPGGRCAFFVERINKERAGDFHLEHHGRFSHRAEYVVDCLAAAGFRILARSEAPIRSEAGHPVIATLFLAGG